MPLFVLIYFLFFREVGYFTRARIPLELMQIEILSSIKSLPLFLVVILAQVLVVFVSPHPFFVKIKSLGWLIPCYMIVWIYWLELSSKILGIQLIVCSLSIAIFYCTPIIRKKHLQFGSLVEKVASFIIILCSVNSVSYHLGYLEANPLIATRKFNTNKKLHRIYSNYAIYTDFQGNSQTNDSVRIFVQYSPDDVDTLINYYTSNDLKNAEELLNEVMQIFKSSRNTIHKPDSAK